MRLRLALSSLGVVSVAVGLWCCSGAESPSGPSTPDGSLAPQDASGTGTGAGCVVTVSGARTGQYPCRATSSQSVAQDAGQWLVDTLAVVSADLQVPTSFSKITGVRCLGPSAPKVGTFPSRCECGFSEVAQDGGPASQWGSQVTTMRVDSVSASGPPEFYDASGVTVTPLTVHGSASCDAPDTFGSGAPPVRIEVRF